MVTAIPGVIAAGQKWTSIWTGTGNNADGIIADKDGGILAAQNTNSDVMLIDKDNKVSFPIKDTRTGGALSRNKKGALFIVARQLPSSIWQLEPKRQKLTDTYNGEPLDCIGIRFVLCGPERRGQEGRIGHQHQRSYFEPG
jgi:hypothetical protein